MNPRWWYCGPPVHPTYLWILLEPELHLGERHVGAEDSFAAAAATARPKQFINYQSLRSITIDYLFGQSLSPPHSYIFYLFSWTFCELGPQPISHERIFWYRVDLFRVVWTALLPGSLKMSLALLLLVVLLPNLLLDTSRLLRVARPSVILKENIENIVN